MTAAESSRIRVVIADDHPVYLSGLRMSLETLSSVEVVGEARSGTDALAAAHRLQPDMVLMDVKMPGISGIEATKVLASKLPGTAVVILTMMEDAELFLAAMRAGARGYLLKGVSAEDVSRAIHMVRKGGLVFGPKVSGWAVDHLTRPPASGNPFPQLTDRELAVLEFVADGKGNAAIAAQLGLSVKTVRNYLSRIFAKLQTADRTEAAIQARRAGLGH